MENSEELPEQKKNEQSQRKPGRPRSERARRAILDAAHKALREGGLGTLTMRKLYEGAKASAATIYRWWPNKESVILEAFLEMVEVQTRSARTDRAVDDLREHVRGGAAFLCSPRGRMMADVIAEGLRNPELRATLLERFYKPRRELALEIIERAIQAGEIDPSTDPNLLIDAIYGPVYLRLLVGHLSPSEEFAMQAFEHALRPVARDLG